MKIEVVNNMPRRKSKTEKIFPLICKYCNVDTIFTTMLCDGIEGIDDEVHKYTLFICPNCFKVFVIIEKFVRNEDGNYEFKELNIIEAGELKLSIKLPIIRCIDCY